MYLVEIKKKKKIRKEEYLRTREGIVYSYIHEK